MWFRMLGPLEVVDGGRPVVLGGARRRATLGFLLLHANRVVATSQLLDALWTDGDAPLSARKILQNAIWGLRGVLSSGDGSGHLPELLTQAPGYVLRVDPDQIDLARFHRLVQQGRAELTAGSPELASATLGDALTLWRGPLLADLIETGISWPELISVQNTRLDAMEDYFEVELACGRHQAVLSELDKMVESNTLRERCCGQLMLALYRCGRQADALNVYGRVRRTLVEQLGLDPCRDLQTLHHAILNHDPELTFRPSPSNPPHSVMVATASQERLATTPEPDPDDQNSDAESGIESGSMAGLATTALPRPRTVTAERMHISALIVHTQLASAVGDSVQVDEIRESVAATVRTYMDYSGGTVAASLGSVSLALFGVPHSADNDAERAVRAALMVRDRLVAAVGASVGMATAEVTLSTYVAVATGEALVRYRPDNNSPPLVTGVLLDECQALLSSVPDGEIRVCDRTRAATASLIAYDQVGTPAGGWQVSETRQEHVAHYAVPIIDRDCELDLLRGLLGRVLHRCRPHLVTVMGEPGTGKSRIAMEFARRVAGHPDSAQFLVSRARPGVYEGDLAVLAEILASYCGIQYNDSTRLAQAKLGTAVEDLMCADEKRNWLLARLGPLLDPLGTASDRFSTAELLDAWRQLIEQIALHRPIVLVIDDVHLAEDTLLDLLEQLAGSSMPVPLLVMATARPELHRRRPEWGGGQVHGATITLDPISDSAIDRLLEFLSSTANADTSDSSAEFLAALLAGVEENVSLPGKRQYVRALLTSNSSPGLLAVPARMGMRARTSSAALSPRRPRVPR
jgi:DNA-binding SARP family transcriptional activator